MKKYVIIALLSLITIIQAQAQEYKVNKTTGKMVLNLCSATVEGYNGTQVVFSSTRDEADQDPRAKGLRAINGAGFTDNTGLGISVTENGTTMEVNQVAANLSIKILVPKDVIVSYNCRKVQNAGKVYFKNMQNEIEISTEYNAIELENVTGPVSVRAIYGSVDARFSAPVKGPISIASIYSTVDVAIPLDTKANIKLSSEHGSILAAADMKIEMEKTPGSDMISYGNMVNGKLNGGGPEFKLTADYGKIYLRKSK
ncbi:MAG TPA: hypothetical protein VGN20_21930 [Mucilaginibacter sp.]|jgi:hypothetical protein